MYNIDNNSFLEAGGMMNEKMYGKLPIKKLFKKLAIPSIITMIVGSLTMVVDGVFMGQYFGSEAMAAVNLIMPIMLIVFTLSDMIGSGAAVRMGILLGEKKKEEASRVFSVSMLSIFAVSLVLSILGGVFLEDLIFLVLKDDGLAKIAYNYSKYFIYTLPIIIPLFALDNFLITCGKIKTSMWINVFVALFNILLNVIFIAILGFGLEFLAISTVISLGVGSIISLMPFLLKKLSVTFGKPKIAGKDFKMILYNGSSEFFEGISSSIMIMITNGLVLSIAGTQGVAAISIISYIEMLLMPILGGVIGGVLPAVTYNYGAKDKARVDGLFKITCISSAVVSAISILIMFLFPEFLASIFLDNGGIDVKNMAITGLLIYAPSYLFIWFNIIAGTFLTAFEKPTSSIVIMMLDSILLPVILFFSLTPFMGINGIFLSQTLSSAFTFIVAIVLWKKNTRNLDYKKEEKAHA